MSMVFDNVNWSGVGSALGVASRLPACEVKLLEEKLDAVRAAEAKAAESGREVYYPDPGQTTALLAYIVGRCLRAVKYDNADSLLVPLAALLNVTTGDLQRRFIDKA